MLTLALLLTAGWQLWAGQPERSLLGACVSRKTAVLGLWVPLAHVRRALPVNAEL